MPKQPNDDTTVSSKLSANKRREVKEITTKITNLSPLATAEVVNGVLTREVGRQLNGFVAFFREQGVVALAIGLVLGIQVKSVVDQFMASFITPLLGLILPGNEQSFAKQSFTISLNGKHQTFVWGSFAISFLTLLIVAAIIYYTYKLLRLDKLAKKKE